MFRNTRYCSYICLSVLVLLMISLQISCQETGITLPTNGSYDSNSNSGGSFEGERELIAWAMANRSEDIEFTWFDKTYRIVSQPGDVNVVQDDNGDFMISGIVTNQGLYAVIAYNSSTLSYDGFSVEESGIINLAMHPELGAVVVGLAPAGVSSATFTAHLNFSAGSERPIKSIQKAPTGDQNIVDDLVVADALGDWHLTWSEMNLADYSNDGEVGIPDITPIAQFFNTTVNHDDPMDQAAIIDGDFSNEIGVSDITPIAQNYLNEVALYYVYRWQPSIGWEHISDVTRPATFAPNWLPPDYEFTDTGTTSADTYYAVRPVDSEGEAGIPSIVVGVPGADPTVEPDPPDEPTQPVSRVDLDIAEVMPFSVETGESKQYSIVLDSTDTNYVMAFTSLGDPSNVSSPVSISKGAIVNPGGTVSRSIVEPTPEGLLNIALERKANELLRNGHRPNSTDRRTSTIGDVVALNIVFADMNPDTLDCTVNGVLRAENSRVRIWVDEQVDDDRFEVGQLDALATITSDIALAQEETTYGGIYDPDSDDKFDILLTPQINAIPGQVRGLFVTNDLQDSIGTNTRDLIYLDVPDCTEGVTPGTYNPIAPGIFDGTAPISKESFESSVRQEIAHEMQHLINYSNRLKIRDAHSVQPTVEETWLNEGLSHFTEDFVGYQSGSNYLMISSFLEMNEITPVIWPTSMDSPVPRGGVNLFVRYIYDQYGDGIISNILLKSIPSVQYTGIANIENATGDQIEDIYRNWLATMSFVGWDVTPGAAYQYDVPATHPDTGGLTGITFLEEFADYTGEVSYLPRPTYHRLDYEPMSFDLLPNAPAFVLINNDSAGTQLLTITAGANNPVYGVFVRVADEAQAKEDVGNSTAFDFFRFFEGEISSGSEQDNYNVVVPSDGRVYVRVVSCVPGQLKPVISVQGNVQSDLNPMDGSALFYFNLTGGGGGLTFGVSSSDETTGKYLISAEFYPE